MFSFLGNDNMLPALGNEPLRSLILRKWCSYQILFFPFFLYHLIIMTAYTYWTVHRPITNITPAQGITEENVTISEALISRRETIPENDSFIGEMVFNIVASLYLFSEVIDLISNVKDAIQYRLRRGQTGYYKAPWSVIFNFDEFRYILMVFGSCIILGSYMRNSNHISEDVYTAIALVTGWYYMLSFCRLFKPISYYTVMVHRMIVTDIFRFAAVFIFIMLGFAAANLVLFCHSLDPLQQVSSFDQSAYSLFRLMIGLETWSFTNQAPAYVHVAADVAFFSFVILTMILLLNMLIASMTDTYAAISAEKDNLRLSYLALTCLTLERRLMPFVCIRCVAAKRYLETVNSKKRLFALHVRETKDADCEF